MQLTVFHLALQQLIEKRNEHLIDKQQGKNLRQQQWKPINLTEFRRCLIPMDAPSWAIKTSVRILY